MALSIIQRPQQAHKATAAAKKILASKVDIAEDAEIIKANDKKEIVTETFTDPRDGEVYKLVTIGDQVWMAENLRYNPSNNNAVAFEDDEDNIKKFGMLYGVPAIFEDKVVPKGFHLPCEEDLKQLLDFVQDNCGDENVAACLKSKKGWKYSSQPKGLDMFGFRLLPAGFQNEDEQFRELGKSGSFWVADEDSDGDELPYFELRSDGLFDSRPLCLGEWGERRYIRCIKDEEFD